MSPEYLYILEVFVIGKKINLVHCKPNIPRFNILNSHLEVIESLLWGFKDLGFECTFRTNEIDNSCINIIFGWQVAFQLIQHRFMSELPADTILYNLEQYSTQPMKGYPLAEQAAEKYQIWDYSIGNIVRWKELNPKFEPYYAKVGFAPNLIKIPFSAKEDIDIAFIGSLGPRRSEKMISCGSTLNRNSVVSLCNVWGEMRDEFISRSKVLINISEEQKHMKVFEIVRVSYYLANKKAVVCEFLPGMEIEDDILQVIKFEPAESIATACDVLVHNTEIRKNYAEECFETFRQRDVRDVIRNFFS